MTKLHVVLI